MHTRSARAALLAAAASSFLFVAACGDDDEPSADAVEAAEDDFDVEAFCAAAAVLGPSEDPTEEQIEAYGDAAPPEIRDDFALVSGAFAEAVESGDFSGLEDPEVVEASDALAAAEQEHCGIVAG